MTNELLNRRFCTVIGCEKLCALGSKTKGTGKRYPDKHCPMHKSRLRDHGELGPAYSIRRPRGSGGVTNTGHWTISIRGKRVLMHRLLWEQIHGPIPLGYDIHHINENPADNRIENLQCMPHGEHRKMHNFKRYERDPERMLVGGYLQIERGGE